MKIMVVYKSQLLGGRNAQSAKPSAWIMATWSGNSAGRIKVLKSLNAAFPRVVTKSKVDPRSLNLLRYTLCDAENKPFALA